MRVFRLSLLLLLAAPAAAHAAAPQLAIRGVGGSLSVAPRVFQLVGLHWRGSGTLAFRARRLGGGWTRWYAAMPEGDDLPDSSSPESRRSRGWRIGNPYWVGRSDAIQVRRRGRVTAVRAFYVTAGPPSRVPLRRLAIAGAPPIVTRLAWGADESIRRAPPVVADRISFAVVHHTAGPNSYSVAESPAIVRSIEIYHVKSNGWNDIGYNFLVDKYGQVFEGRYGGIERNVVGAHALGFNTGSVGVSVIGTYGSTSITPAARASLEQLLAWRLDLAHLDPLSTLSFLSGGNPRFPSGIPVFLRAVSGHRDTGFTDCPGNALYAELPAIAKDVSALGGPKLYSPAVKGGLGGPVRFTARLSAPLPWTVTVTDAASKAVVATGTGTGTAVDWTWDATTVAPAGRYVWTIAAGAAVRPAQGQIGKGQAVTLTLANVAASPTTITPNGDGLSDTTLVTYSLSLPAQVTATLVDPAGAVVATLFTDLKPAGDNSFTFSGTDITDGSYRIVITAKGPDGREVNASVAILVSRTLAAFAVEPNLFSPNGDGRLDTVAFVVSLNGPAQVTVRLERHGRTATTPFSGDLPAGVRNLTWGGRVPDGTYRAAVTVKDSVGTVVQGVPLRVDTTPPRIALVSLRPLRLRLSEAAALALTVNGRRLGGQNAAGVVSVTGVRRARTVRAVATDSAGNRSRPLVVG